MKCASYCSDPRAGFDNTQRDHVLDAYNISCMHLSALASSLMCGWYTFIVEYLLIGYSEKAFISNNTDIESGITFCLNKTSEEVLVGVPWHPFQ